MSRPTRNSRDAGLLPEVAPAIKLRTEFQLASPGRLHPLQVSARETQRLEPSSSEDSGFMARGPFPNNRSLLPIRNCFLWLLQLLFGDLSGAGGMFCFTLIMMRSSTS